MHIASISNTNTTRFNVNRATIPQNKSQNFGKGGLSYVELLLGGLAFAALSSPSFSRVISYLEPLPKASKVATKDSLEVERLRALVKTKYREADSLSIAIDKILRHKK